MSLTLINYIYLDGVNRRYEEGVPGGAAGEQNGQTVVNEDCEEQERVQQGQPGQHLGEGGPRLKKDNKCYSYLQALYYPTLCVRP